MYFISDIKKMLSSRIVQITFIFLLVTMLADPISVLIHARRYTGFFENIGANPFQFWLLMNSASWGNKVYNILFWVIPVLATGMIYYNEQSSSMSKFLVVRKSKLRYMLSKVISVFSFTFVFCMFLLSLNLLLTFLIFDVRAPFTEQYQRLVPNAGTFGYVGNDIASISDANMELVRSVNGTAIEETITTADGKQILLNAQVNTESVETIQQYQYEVLPVTDELRETLFTTFFGARASEAIYDQRNDVWELHNSEAIGDYYLYEHTIAMAGESVPGEEIFTLGYRDVNLYPFEDNLLSSSAECGVSIPLEDVISLCGTITDAIAPQNSYTADTVLPYGNQGRRPYYTIFFRLTAGGMPIIGYNDLYFLVDSNGIQTISGALYGLTAQPLSSELLSLEDAVASLRENTSLIDFYGEDTLSVGAISLEYIVTLTETQEAVAIPAWRFQIGTNDNSLMINRRRVLAVNAVTGELIQGERGRSF